MPCPLRARYYARGRAFTAMMLMLPQILLPKMPFSPTSAYAFDASIERRCPAPLFFACLRFADAAGDIVCRRYRYCHELSGYDGAENRPYFVTREIEMPRHAQAFAILCALPYRRPLPLCHVLLSAARYKRRDDAYYVYFFER